MKESITQAVQLAEEFESCKSVKLYLCWNNPASARMFRWRECDSGWKISFAITFLVFQQVVMVECTQPTIPMVRPLRRVVTNFQVGRTASILIVSQMRGQFTARWYYKEAGGLQHAVYPDMLTVDSDDRFEVSRMQSYDVWASKLEMANTPNRFPFVFTIVFTSEDEDSSWQYRLTTEILKTQTGNRIEDLDGIIWLEMPPVLTTYEEGGQFEVKCGVKFRNMSDSDELMIYKNSWMLDLDDYLVHRASVSTFGEGMNSRNEEYANIYKGSTINDYGWGFKKYMVSYKVKDNATSGEQGLYTCEANRSGQKDVSSVSTFVKMVDSATASVSIPYTLQVIPCSPYSNNREITTETVNKNVTMATGSKNCVRCLAYGYPRARFSVLFNGVDISTNDIFYLDHYLNVAKGGISEVTIIVLNANPSQHNGNYECRAYDQDGVHTSIPFNIIVGGVNAK